MLMAKVNTEYAYQLGSIPVHPDDHWLLGMQHEGTTFMDTVLLPFGLRSAPKLFNVVAQNVGMDMQP